MDRRQLVAHVARTTTLTRAQAREALDAILDTIAATLATGDPVILRDFGRFSPEQYSERNLARFGRPGRYHVKARVVPTFKASETLRRRLREKV